MDLINRYLYAVGRRLPSGQRADIEKELKSLITDTLDARVDGREPSEEDIIAVINEFGPPAKVAARYNRNENWLIGPQLIDVYHLVIRIVLGTVILALLVSAAVEVALNGSGMSKFFASFFAGIIPAGLSAVGAVTIVFALIEKFSPDLKTQVATHQDKWNPRTLPVIPPARERVTLAGPLVSIGLTILTLIVVNQYTELIGFYFRQNTGAKFIPVFSQPDLALYLPWWNVLWVVGIILNFMLLREGHWQFKAYLLAITISAGSIIVAVWMLNGPVVISQTLADSLSSMFHVPVSIIYRFVLGMAIFGSAINIIQKVFRLIRSRVDFGKGSRTIL